MSGRRRIRWLFMLQFDDPNFLRAGYYSVAFQVNPCCGSSWGTATVVYPWQSEWGNHVISISMLFDCSISAKEVELHPCHVPELQIGFKGDNIRSENAKQRISISKGPLDSWLLCILVEIFPVLPGLYIQLWSKSIHCAKELKLAIAFLCHTKYSHPVFSATHVWPEERKASKLSLKNGEKDSGNLTSKATNK